MIDERLAEAPGRRLKLVANLPYSIATPVVSNLVAPISMGTDGGAHPVGTGREDDGLPGSRDYGASRPGFSPSAT
ncbi:MAG: hypothetical protein CM1200mP2_42720 [Planctomycetaceae bacterium]|nr:MAG: hypothetical protein CM1200mP2_42720 [Planctomycetaceae bacterium]